MEYFSQVFVLILSTWKFGFIIFLSAIQRIILFLSAIQRLIIFLSAIQRIIIFLSPIWRIIIFLSSIWRLYLISSKCKQALIFYSGCKPALIFVLLSMKQCPIVVSKQFHISLLFFELFWICFKCYFWLCTILLGIDR